MNVRQSQTALLLASALLVTICMTACQTGNTPTAADDSEQADESAITIKTPNTRIEVGGERLLDIETKGE